MRRRTQTQATVARRPRTWVERCSFVWVSLLCATAAFGQPGALEDARRAYRALDYAQAKETLAVVIADPTSLSPDELAEAHLILGTILFSENRPEAARQQFVAAIQLSPEIKLNAQEVSPKIVEFFESIRTNGTLASNSAAVRYVTIYDARPSAALRSMVLPGWGQYYKGERTKAYWIWSTWSATAGGTVATHFLRRRAKSRYLDETDPERVVDRYRTFNDWHKTRSGFALAAGVVWAYSYIDSIIRHGRQSIRTQQERTSLSIARTDAGTSAAITIPIGGHPGRR